jgi:hypothetical protein
LNLGNKTKHANEWNKLPSFGIIPGSLVADDFKSVTQRLIDGINTKDHEKVLSDLRYWPTVLAAIMGKRVVIDDDGSLQPCPSS